MATSFKNRQPISKGPTNPVVLLVVGGCFAVVLLFRGISNSNNTTSISSFESFLTSNAALPTRVPKKIATTTVRLQALQEGLDQALKDQPARAAASSWDHNKQQQWKGLLGQRAEFLEKHATKPPGALEQLSNPVFGPPEPPTAVILGKGDELYRKGTWDKSPIILEKYKLMFFTVPKVGCTAFKQLFRRMMGHSNWQDHQYYTQPFLPHNPDANGLKYLSDYPFEVANEMLVSENWTRAIFTREPKERVLSAYLDKAGYSQGSYVRMQCCGRLVAGSSGWAAVGCAEGNTAYTKPQEGETNTPILPFHSFLTQVMPACSDPHWETQATRMAPKYWNQINFVGRFENVFEDTKKLLEQVRAWEEFGASGWTGASGEDGAMFDPNQKAKHGTSAQNKMSKDQYFTHDVLQAIVQYYAADFDHPVLEFQKPEIPAVAVDSVV